VRLAFMGSPDFAVPALRALHAAGHDVAAVYCQPPRPAGRGHAVRRCPVHVAAEALGLAVRTPARLRGNATAQAEFAALDLDAAVVAAYGLILPAPMLSAPRRGCLNIHASLLPRWRGAAPIQAAILAGDAQTGITIMQMDAGLDTGPILLQQAVPITEDTTAAALHDTLAELGAARREPAANAAAGGGRDLCPEAQPGRWTTRLAAGRRRARPARAGAEPLAGDLCPARRQAAQGAGREAGAGRGRAGHGAG
jgi:methionyl-tRNA formyltransferase